ncbi:MAG: nitrate reductase [Rhodospirillales bacterium]|nr:nitrate reductase [Rhodospirillales bacterium]
MTAVKTTCPYCGVGCGVIVAPDRTVRGDPDHPANMGRLCSKGSALGETLDDSGRLLRPRVDGAETGWDEALDFVARRFANTIAEHGPDSVAFYGSGQFLTEDYYVANKLMKGFIGSANIDTNSRLCMASTVAGHVRAFGADVVPGVYEDWDEADLVILVGSNTAWCHPVLFQRLVAARAERGTKIVVVDPRRTATCDSADLHLQLAPGSDVALFAGLLNHISESRHLDAAWVATHTTGLEAALEVAKVSAGTVAKITRLPESDLRAFYDLFVSTERVMTVFSQGVNQSSAGTDKVNAIINCHLATGRIGRPGMGPFSVTGQPNAMGGREVGGLANQLAAHMSFDRPGDVDRVGRFWNAANMASWPGLKAVDLFDAVRDGRVKALWIMATNPAASMPRVGLIREALEACPFVVVSDCWNTDTTALADVVLPAASWGEKNGTATNSERCISRQRPFRAAVGEARPDWWIISKVAQGMGWGDAFTYRTAADVFREHAALSAFENDGVRAFNIGAFASVSDDEYDALTQFRWPARAGRENAGRMFAGGGFFTPDRKARFVPTAWRAPVAKQERRFPYMLNTGRIRDQWHTMTRTGLTPRLMAHQDEPYVELHPHDAMKLGVDTGDLLRVQTAHGAAILRAQVTDGQRIGDIFVPMHWTDRFSSSGPVDRLVSGVCDPISGQPELKATAAHLTPIPTLWRGLMIGPETLRESGFYHARIPVGSGPAQRQFYEMRGWAPLPDVAELADWVTRFIGQPQGAGRVELIDPARGTYRFANVVDGRLHSCLMLSSKAQFPPPERSALIAMMDGLDSEAKLRMLSVVCESAEAAPARRMVCACFSIDRTQIEQAIRAGRLDSAAGIGGAVKAGTNCGSCIPELKEILRNIQVGA